MKVLIVSGHEGYTGAVSGGRIEANLTEDLATRVANYLKSKGVDATEADFNLYEKVEENPDRLDMRVYDYILEIHFNITPGATGSEIFVPSGSDIKVEQAIMRRMAKYFTIRDDSVKDLVKVDDSLRILRALRDRDIALLEVCFMDNPSDMAKYTANIQNIAVDIAEGIMEGKGFVPKPAQAVVSPASPSLDKAQAWAVNAGIMRGRDWDKPMTRSQLAWILFDFMRKIITPMLNKE